MTVRGSWIWLIEIEGLGSNSNTDNNQFAITPMALTSENWPTDSAFAGGFATSRICGTWVPVLQKDSVTLSEMTYSPFAAKPGAQTLTFTLSIPDSVPEIERYFLSNPNPVATITNPINPTDSTITVDSTANIPAGSIIYIGAEAFRVRSKSPTTLTINQAIIGGSSTNGPDITWPNGTSINVGTRAADGAVGIIGAFGTRIAYHAVPTAGQLPPFPDNRVYLANNRVKGRRVYLRRVSWGLNQSGEYGYREQLYGQYVIRDSTINSEGTTITISAASLISSYDKSQLGSRGVSDRLKMYYSSNGAPIALVELDVSPASFDRRIWKQNFAAYSDGTNAGFFVGTDFVGTSVLNGIAVYRAVRTTRSLGLKLFYPEKGIMEESDEDMVRFISGETGTNVKEVLMSDPFSSIYDTSGYEQIYQVNIFELPYYSNDKPGGAGVLGHPLHLLLAHLGQLSSNLPLHWQLRLDKNSVATETILAIAEQLTINEWPGVCVTGPVNAMEWLSKTFLQPIACGFVTDEFGRLSVASATSPRQSPWSVPAVFLGTSAVLSIDASVLQQGRQVQRIVEAEAGITKSSTGQGLGKEPRLNIESADAYLIADGDPESSVFSIDASGALSPDNPAGGIEILDSTTIMFVRSITSSIGTYLRGGAIQYTFIIPSGVPDEDEQYQPFGNALAPAMPSRYALLGCSVNIAAVVPGLRKLPGPRNGLVLAHSWQNNFTSQKIRVLDIGSSVKIAPSGRVVSATDNLDGTMSIVLIPDFEIHPVPYDISPFGEVLEDGESLSAFAVTSGDYEFIRFYDSTLADRNPGSGNAEQVISYDIATNTLLATYSSSYLPVADDFVLLAELGETDVDDFYAFMGRDKFTM